jgi:hypothetical protein
MVKTIHAGIIVVLFLCLTACDEEWMDDNNTIARDDFVAIQIEQDICHNYSDSRACLRHLKARIH